MTTGPVAAAADAPHAPSDDPWWSEAWHLDVAQDDGTGLYVRLECFPNRRVAWFWTALVLPDLAGPVLVREQEVPLPRQGLEIRAEALWAELWCETPLEHWTYGLEAFGVRLDAPVDAFRGELGERVAIGLDIEWELVTTPYVYEVFDNGRRGFAQHGRVDGDVSLGRTRRALAATGARRRSWGRRDWFGAPTFGAWYRTDDVDVTVRVVAGRVRGRVWRNGVFECAVSQLREETHRDADGLPTAARLVLDDVEIDVEVLALAPLLVEADGRVARVARACCRFVPSAGPPGIGWASWRDPVPGP